MDLNRNLLVGLLAFQCGLITRAQLVAALRARPSMEDQPLEQILEEQGVLTPERRKLVVELVAELLQLYQQNTEMCLASLSSIGTVRQELEALGDVGLNATLALVAENPVHDATVRFTLADENAAATERKVPRYRALRLHAKGGLGEIYVARDEELHREVALKEIQDRFADNAESRTRFKQEAEITGNLEHPGIVPVYGLGQYEDGRPYYAMRFIRGDSLKEAIDKHHAKHTQSLTVGEAGLELRKLLRRFSDVCNAVEYAHSRGVLHRDLKPGNIILGKYGETLVVDWGLAKTQGQKDNLDDGLEPVVTTSGSGTTPTLVGSAVGTPAYMSPEQAAGRVTELGPATDVYSLGATLFHLLTGKPPIVGKNPLELVEKAERGEIRRPREVRGDVPKPLEAVCLKAMAKDPAERYVSPGALSEEIEKWLADEPISAYSEPLRVKARRLIKRHPALAAGTVACIGLGLASAIFVAYLNGKHAKELSEKNFILADQNSTISEQKRALEETNVELLVAKNKAQDAEQTALREKEIAEKNLEFAKKGNDILGSVFDELDPDETYQTVGEIRQALTESLNKAVANLEGSVIGDALTVAGMQNKLGKSLNALGDSKNAVMILKKAYQTRTELLGVSDKEALASGSNLALALRTSGDLNAALPLYEEIYERSKTVLGEDDPTTLIYMNNIAVAYRKFGKFEMSAKLFEDHLKKVIDQHGTEHADTVAAMHNLATSYEALGKLDLALKMLGDALTQLKKTKGPSHRETLSCTNNLARVYQRLGRVREAIPLFEEVLEKRRTYLGMVHPDTLRSMNNLADAYRNDGQLNEAKLLHEENLRLKRASLGLDHPDTLGAMTNLAEVYRALNQMDIALPLMEEAQKAMKEKLGPLHPDTFTATNNLATAYLTHGKTEQGVKLLEETLDQVKEKFGAEHPNTLVLMNNVATAYQKVGKLEQAVELFEETLKIKTAKLGEDHPSTLSGHVSLGLAYCAVGNGPLAVTTLEKATEKIRARYPKGDKRFEAILAQAGTALVECGQFAAAEKYLRECLDGRQKAAPESQVTLSTMRLLAVALVGQKKFDEAKPLLLSAFAAMEKLPESSSAVRAEMRKCSENLVELYKALNQPEEVKQWSARTEALSSDIPPNDSSPSTN